MPRLATAKEIISQASLELGTSQKGILTVTASLDQDISQALALLDNVADELLLDEPYSSFLGDGYWVVDKDGEPKLTATTDTDVVLFDRRLAIDGLKYRFLRAKGLEFGEELRDFTTRMNKLATKHLARVIDLDTDAGREI